MLIDFWSSWDEITRDWDKNDQDIQMKIAVLSRNDNILRYLLAGMKLTKSAIEFGFTKKLFNE